MTARLLTSLACVFGLTAVFAAPAHAQQAPATAGLQVSELENGFVVAPDVRFTTVNDRSSTLAGVYGGYELDKTLFIGAAGYWNTNRDRDFELQYGGGVVKWTLLGHNPVSVSIGSLVGVGSATLTRSYGDLFGTPIAVPANVRMGPNGQVVTTSSASRLSASTQLRIHDDFVVAEPQVTVMMRLAPWVRLDVGGGYRFIGSSRYLDDQLKGASGSVAIRFGVK